MDFKLDFYTQYRQFYISDKLYASHTGDWWDKDAFEDRLDIKHGNIGVRIECYGPVKGELAILSGANHHFEADKYDHIVEGGLDVDSGFLQILDCPNSSVELEINLAPGAYRVRIYSSNLASVTAFEGDDEYPAGDAGDDYYKIEVWPAENKERMVLKRYAT